MKTTKVICMGIFQSKQVKKRWNDMQDSIKKTVWKQKRMLVIGLEIKIYGQVQNNGTSREYMRLK